MNQHSSNSHGPRRALIVDDEMHVRKVTSRMMQLCGFDVLTATDGQEAIELFLEKSDEIDLVLIDLTMPRMGGEEALSRMREHRPDLDCIVMTGYDADDAYSRLRDDTPLLRKPFDMADLRACLGLG